MTSNHKDATSKTAQNIAKKKIADFKKGTTLDGELNLLIFQMLDYPVYCGKGYIHTKFKDLTANTGLTDQEITDALEKYGLRGPDGKWDSDVLLRGLIANVSYSGLDAAKNEMRLFNYDLCTPHGNMFFEAFFNLLKIWSWKPVKVTTPTVNN